MTQMSLPRIGDAFGGRDHTTILNSCDKVTQMLETSQMKSTVADLKKIITEK